MYVSAPYNKISCKQRPLFEEKVCDSFTTSVELSVMNHSCTSVNTMQLLRYNPLSSLCVIYLLSSHPWQIYSFFVMPASRQCRRFILPLVPPRTRNLIFVHVVYHHRVLDAYANIELHVVGIARRYGLEPCIDGGVPELLEPLERLLDLKCERKLDIPFPAQ